MNGPIEETELHALIDGELAEARAAEVRDWLARHPEAGRRLEAYRSQKRAITQALEAEARHTGDAKTHALERRLAQKLNRPARWPQQFRRAAAIVLLLATGWSGNVLFERYLAHRMPAMVGDAARAHEIFAEDRKRPVELAAWRSNELETWFSDHLGEPVEIPSLHSLGLRFMGGRLISSDEGPLAQMIYEDDKRRRLSLYLSSSGEDDAATIEIVKIDGFNAGYWSREGFVYTIVAETPSEQLIAIASELGGSDEGTVR